MTVEESILVEEIKKGNEKVFEAQYLRYYQSLVVFAMGFLHDSQVSEEVAQNLFLTIWENRSKLNITTSFKAYLFVSVRNRCLKRLKKLKIEDQNKVLYAQALLDLYTHPKYLEEEDKDDLSLMLSEAIAELPDQIRQIISLKYLQKKKISEISEILGVSENTIKTQLQRGKSKLRVSFSKSTGFSLLL